jgi:hypothetical protein
MAEPQPPGIHEGASTPPAPPAAASAAAEASALSSLDNKTLSDAPSGPKKEVDLKALNDAMKALDSGSSSKKATAAGGSVKKDEEPAKLIKVDGGDVTLLVSGFVFLIGMRSEGLVVADYCIQRLGRAARSLSSQSYRIAEST